MNMWEGLIGGALIGAAAVWLYVSLGRVAGISGIAANALFGFKAYAWPVFFVVGLGVGGWLTYAIVGMPVPVTVSLDHALMLVGGGLLVGYGTRLGSGCTSGHGVCGISRFSVRSLSATITFLSVGIVTATLVSLA